MSAIADFMHRLPNDVGGLPSASFERVEHELKPWEKRCHALADVLDFHKIINTEEKRSGVELLGAEMIGKLSYYERWIVAFANILFRKGILTPTELALKMEEVLARWPATTAVRGKIMTDQPWTIAKFIALMLWLSAPAWAADPVKIDEIIVARPIPDTQRDATLQAARAFYEFWNTGDDALLAQAIAPNFTDRTLPAGRPQGPQGPAFASHRFRAAVPDLGVEVKKMIIADDYVTVHMVFTGHFTGKFGQMQGKGQWVNFIATDLLKVEDGRITSNWHIEDNLTLMRQLGLITQ
jgi:predicted ester cyclase